MRLCVAHDRWRGLPAWLGGMTAVVAIAFAGRAGMAGEAPALSAAVADPFRWPAAGTPLAPARSPAPRDAPPADAAPAASSAHAMRQLRLIGIVRQGARAVALLSVGDAVLPVRAGQRIGASDAGGAKGASDGMGGGVVSRVDDGHVHIQWPYQDADGHWKAVDQTLTLDGAAP